LSFGHYIEVGRMDELSRLDSPLHRLDARIKTLTTAAFILTVKSIPRYEVSALMPFFLYPFALLSAGRIPCGFILRKLLIAAPFALAVGILNPLLDRQIVLILGTHEISGGWMSFASIAVRFSLTVSAALILISCTGIQRLCAGLDQLGLPQVFVVQLQLLYRYLFVIAEDGLRMRRAVELRSCGQRSLRLSTYASLVGHLLLRSMDRAQRVYQAMAARGFTGRIHVLHATPMKMGDFFFLAGWAVFFGAARYWNLAKLLGGLLAGDGA